MEMRKQQSTLLAVVLWLGTANGYIPSTDRLQQHTPLFQKPQTRPRTVVIDTLQLLPFYFPVKVASSSSGIKGESVVRLNPVLEKNPFESLQAARHLKKQQQQHVTEPFATQPGEAWQQSNRMGLPPSPLSSSCDASTTISSMAAQRRQQDQEDRRQAFFVSSSAALAGFTDVLVLARHGCFVNMMTGTLLKMITAIANLSIMGALVQASVVLCYMAGLRLFAKIKEKQTKDDPENAKMAPLRLVAPLVLGLFGLADLLTRGAVGNASKLIQVPLLAMGFAVINSAAAHATGNTIFFAMTGHLTKLTHSLPLRQQAEDNKVIQTSKSIMAYFLGGALLAAVGLRLQHRMAIAGMMPPLCTSLGLLYAGLFAWYAPPKNIMTTLLPMKKLQLLGRLKMVTLSQRIRYTIETSTRRPTLVTVANMLSPNNSTTTLASGF
jgi:Protein of unknown function (DUF1275)